MLQIRDLSSTKRKLSRARSEENHANVLDLPQATVASMSLKIFTLDDSFYKKQRKLEGHENPRVANEQYEHMTGW